MPLVIATSRSGNGCSEISFARAICASRIAGSCNKGYEQGNARSGRAAAKAQLASFATKTGGETNVAWRSNPVEKRNEIDGYKRSGSKRESW